MHKFLNAGRSVDDDSRVRIHTCDELIDELTHEAQAAIEAGGAPSNYGVVSTACPNHNSKA